MDTIKLFLSIYLDTKLFERSKVKWKTTIEKNNIIYYCNYNGVTLKYYPYKYALTLTTSGTKFLYGKNCNEFSLKDLNKLFSDLDFVVRITIKQGIITVRKWIVSRLDLVNNYYCNSIKDKSVYLNILNKLNFSRCKNSTPDDTNESVHKHNRAITYNFYDKHAQDGTSDTHILRMEIQYKNRTLYKLKRNGTLCSKCFEDVLEDINVLNNIYKDRLCKLGLNKKFLTKEEMTKFLRKLYKEKEIAQRKYNNMYNYFINNLSDISKNTLNNYKTILGKYNYSHIILDEEVSKKIDFMEFSLFKDEKKCKLTMIKLMLLLIVLYLLTKNILNITIILQVPFKIFIIIEDIIIFNDS